MCRNSAKNLIRLYFGLHIAGFFAINSSKFLYHMGTALQILGSLGLFLYGMKLMSEGLQKVSGERLRTVMRSMAGNRFKGVFSGTLVTAVIQSSSATTVMVVSFVNAGLLTLRESIGVTSVPPLRLGLSPPSVLNSNFRPSRSRSWDSA